MTGISTLSRRRLPASLSSRPMVALSIVARHRFDGRDHLFVRHLIRGAGKRRGPPVHEDGADRSRRCRARRRSVDAARCRLGVGSPLTYSLHWKVKNLTTPLLAVRHSGERTLLSRLTCQVRQDQVNTAVQRTWRRFYRYQFLPTLPVKGGFLAFHDDSHSGVRLRKFQASCQS